MAQGRVPSPIDFFRFSLHWEKKFAVTGSWPPVTANFADKTFFFLHTCMQNPRLQKNSRMVRKNGPRV